MKRKIKRKLWLDRRSRKLALKKYRRKNKRKNSGNYRNNLPAKKISTSLSGMPIVFKLPSIFSFLDNPDETMQMLGNIRARIIEGNPNGFYVDAQYVEKVSADALMYLLTIIRNTNVKRSSVIQGNLPLAKVPRTLFIESGFLDYMTSTTEPSSENNDKIKIYAGMLTATSKAKELCDFVQEKLNENKIATIPLYKTLIELMSNTSQHAYKEKNGGWWYLFAEHEGGKVRITFVDTGEGIPGTVRRKLFEKIPLFTSDSKLLYSAFCGESRSETMLDNRGHGLPSIYDRVKHDEIIDFHVISGKGYAYNDSESKLVSNEYPCRIAGTIYVFSVSVKGAST